MILYEYSELTSTKHRKKYFVMENIILIISVMCYSVQYIRHEIDYFSAIHTLHTPQIGRQLLHNNQSSTADALCADTAFLATTPTVHTVRYIQEASWHITCGFTNHSQCCLQGIGLGLVEVALQGLRALHNLARQPHRSAPCIHRQTVV